MAEDKNGFLLYKDLIKTVQKLPLDKAGELFMHILKYVNDENPETDDLIIEIAFEPVKQKLKRDLKKYEETKEKNRENALKRWQKENPTVLNGINKNATACDRMPKNTKYADTGNDIDTGTDTGTDILLKKETKASEPTEFFPEEKKSIPVKPPDQEKEKSFAKKEKEVVDYFHEKCKRLPKVLIINQNRKKAINARLHDFGIDKINEMFDLVAESNFLNGENPRTWSADFDWIMKPSNFTKILEGNYANKTHSSKDNNNGEFETNR
ncbi:DUF6291 domain-containing protein [Chryseobacterium viscerum]|uniref:DUF6291 domain-containing protein n=1 Tax=Chryseobacterium viscerum TaxID=1037377 RepID=A0A5N4BK39_9FLAO|nr:DUF6291 domain-containing protein [Chryseobacterium viscerum]KAB1228475.1 hypothetical protein F8D52_22645 [Chryseobacterium viscerum]